MTPEARAVPYEASVRGEWDAFVRRSKNSTFFFERSFMEYHADRFTDASMLIYDDHGDLIGLLPANRAGACVQSHAGLGLGGLITDARMSTTRALAAFAAIVSACREAGALTLEYKTIPHIYHRQPAEEDRYALFLLGATLYRRDVLAVVPRDHRLPFRKGRLSDRNKARRAGLAVEEGSGAAWSEFWHVLADRLSTKHGARPVHTAEEMMRLRDSFPDIIRLFVVRVDGAVAAGCVVYATDQLAHVQYIGSTDAGRACGALDLLFWHLIQERYANLPYFDFGGCNLHDGWFLNRGLVEFKEGFGARAVMHDFYRLDLPTANLGALRADRLE